MEWQASNSVSWPNSDTLAQCQLRPHGTQRAQGPPSCSANRHLLRSTPTRLAIIADRASRTKRRDGSTDVLSPGDKQVVVFDPVFGRQFFSQRGLGLIRGLRAHVSESVAHPVHVGVHANSRLAKSQSNDQVCRLAADALKGQQHIQIVGDISFEPVQQILADPSEVSGFGFVESDGEYNARDFLLPESRGSPRAFVPWPVVSWLLPGSLRLWFAGKGPC